MNATEPCTATRLERCPSCRERLYVKLTRESSGLRRHAYCASCDASPVAVDVTSSACRRAALAAAATREVASGAA